MKVIWDKTYDIARIYLVDNMPEEGVETTVALTWDEANGHLINLHFDASGILLLIEIHSAASKALPKELLDQAEIIG